MKVLHLQMPNGGEDGVILLWESVKKGVRPKWVECRGKPFSQWDINENTPMSQIHDCMEGWHTTVLHQDQILDLNDKHPDFFSVRKFLEES